jgi:hypothetical protein
MPSRARCRGCGGQDARAPIRRAFSCTVASQRIMKSALRMTGLVDLFTASGLYSLRKKPFKLSFRARSPGEEFRFEYSQPNARFLALRPACANASEGRPKAFGPAPADPSPEGGFGPQGEGLRPASLPPGVIRQAGRRLG